MMTTKNDDFRISLFKPTTPQAKINRNLIIYLVSIWAIAIFGFQVLLKVLEKPTPEVAYVNYEKVSGPVISGSANTPELQVFSKSLLSVLGKLYVTSKDKDILSGVLSHTMFNLIPGGQRDSLIGTIKKFEEIKANTPSITDTEYVSAKQSIISTLGSFLGLEKYSIEAKLLPLVIDSEKMGNTWPENIQQLPQVMSKYLIHNQSALTDFKFLGFPFHYFYTAVFLLILFVGLCWIYCIRIDRMHKHLNITE